MTLKTLIAKITSPKNGDLISVTKIDGVTCKTYKNVKSTY